MDHNRLISALQQIKSLADECLADLDDRGKLRRTARKPPARLATKPMNVDFDKPLRPFVRQYAKGLSGTKKFVLLLSWLVKGDPKKEVAIVEIQKHWNKMKAKSLLALDFNDFYPADAKDHDWVEARKKGFYNLRPSWKDVFKNSNG